MTKTLCINLDLTSFWCAITFPSLTRLTSTKFDQKKTPFWMHCSIAWFGLTTDCWGALSGIFYDPHLHFKTLLAKRTYQIEAVLIIHGQDMEYGSGYEIPLDLSEFLAPEYFQPLQSKLLRWLPKKVWTIRPYKEPVVMRLNKQLPINTIRVQIKSTQEYKYRRQKDIVARFTFYIVRALTLIINCKMKFDKSQENNRI